jgi:hypothetical protein
MHRLWLIPGVLALLAGCSPLQMCLTNADQDLREVTRELDTRRANLRYGYSIERVTVPELVASVCPGPMGGAVPCMRWDQSTEEIRHPINPDFERERIALLERQLVQAEAQAATNRAQCAATYPE